MSEEDNSQLQYTEMVQFKMQPAHTELVKEQMMTRLDRGSVNVAMRRIIETILDDSDMRSEVLAIWARVK